MTKQEIVRLVSRALAVIQFVTAAEEITYVPQRMLAAHRYAGVGASSYLNTAYSLELSTLFLRIAGLLTLAWVFWACGPRIANLLLPPEPRAEADGLDQTPGEETAPAE